MGPGMQQCPLKRLPAHVCMKSSSRHEPLLNSQAQATFFVNDHSLQTGRTPRLPQFWITTEESGRGKRCRLSAKTRYSRISLGGFPELQEGFDMNLWVMMKCDRYLACGLRGLKQQPLFEFGQFLVSTELEIDWDRYPWC